MTLKRDKIRNENKIYQHLQKTKELIIDDVGKVWRVKTRQGDHSKWKDITPRRAEYRDKDGYLVVRIKIDGKDCRTMAHRLIYRTFIGLIPIDKEINHKNGNKPDNRLENLELVTPAENQIHALKVLKTGIIGLKGQEHYTSKLVDKDIYIIRKRALTEPLVKIA